MSKLSRLPADTLPAARARNRETLLRILAHFEKPRPVWPLLLANAAGFYTGVLAAAVAEQRYKEAYWQEHPGEAVPVMRSKLYRGKERMRREDLGD